MVTSISISICPIFSSGGFLNRHKTYEKTWSTMYTLHLEGNKAMADVDPLN